MDNNNKSMLKAYREILTKLSKIESELSINASFSMRDVCDFTVTVYNAEHENCTFYFYNHRPPEQIKELTDDMFKVLKTDNFDSILKVCSEPK